MFLPHVPSSKDHSNQKLGKKLCSLARGHRQTDRQTRLFRVSGMFPYQPIVKDRSNDIYWWIVLVFDWKVQPYIFCWVHSSDTHCQDGYWISAIYLNSLFLLMSSIFCDGINLLFYKIAFCLCCFFPHMLHSLHVWCQLTKHWK